jgi:hypothetical protein
MDRSGPGPTFVHQADAALVLLPAVIDQVRGTEELTPAAATAVAAAGATACAGAGAGAGADVAAANVTAASAGVWGEGSRV